ncbi:MAG: tryptophan--tRNA ligase [Desulfobacteraceae bacterium]|nr:tryptophan--tRNA ligase [Desulfobacteraceae bacterium]
MTGQPTGTTTILTGIKPTGRPHLGNYLGSIRPALALAQTGSAYYFVADGHALTSVRRAGQLRGLTFEVAATWIALGLDPSRVTFYRQSGVPEIYELAWILACSTAKGLLNRAHAYKAAMELNQRAGHDADADINAGLYSYPILMAADILAVDADIVPVGRDQQQHIEMARDIAAAFNRTYGSVLKMPEARIQAPVQTITGLDGRKMSKSYRNTIPVLCESEELHRLVMRIVTDSRRPEEPKDPEQCNVFAIYRHMAPQEEIARLRRRYTLGGVAYQEVKEALFQILDQSFAPARERFANLMADQPGLTHILETGAAAARARARRVLARVRRAVGIDAPAIHNNQSMRLTAVTP